MPQSQNKEIETAAANQAAQCAATGASPAAQCGQCPPATPVELRAAWEALKASQPHLYPREGARLLGVSEAQIVALGCGRDTAFRLAPASPVTLLNEMRKNFGALLFIVRNDDAVLEKTASLEFAQKEAHGHAVASAQGDGACLAFVPQVVAKAFAVRAEKFIKRGILFFDALGNAVVKAYLQNDAKLAAFDEWVAPLFAADQSDAEATDSPALPCDHGASAKCPHSDCATHDGCDAAETRVLAPDALKVLLKAAAKSGEAVSLGLHGNHAMFSVDAPAISRVMPAGPWFNVLDDALHTHLRESAVASVKARVDTAAGVLRLSCLGADGASRFTLRVSANSEAARAVLA